MFVGTTIFPSNKFFQHKESQLSDKQGAVQKVNI